jgi:hypothetical protein
MVNLNGATRGRLIAQHKAVFDAATALLNALGNASPQGRDYQTAPALLHNRDRHLWEANCVAVNNIRLDYESITARLVSEGLGTLG